MSLRICLFLSLFAFFVPSAGQAQGRPDPDSAFCGLTLVTVEGTSLAPLLKSGDNVETRPPSCLDRPIRRGDIVLFRGGASANPMIKRVVAAAGDLFAGGGGQLIVNGSPATTSSGEAFRLSRPQANLIAMYQREYNGRLPDGIYIVMGDGPTATNDSARYGPINIVDIMGVVVAPQEVIAASIKGVPVGAFEEMDPALALPERENPTSPARKTLWERIKGVVVKPDKVKAE